MSDDGSLLHRQAHRLLAQHVQARLGRRDDRVGVEVMREADIDRVNDGRGQHRAIVGEDLRAACADGHRLGIVGIDIGDCRHDHLVRGPEVAVDVRPGDRSGADDADPQAAPIGHRLTSRTAPIEADRSSSETR